MGLEGDEFMVWLGQTQALTPTLTLTSTLTTTEYWDRAGEDRNIDHAPHRQQTVHFVCVWVSIFFCASHIATGDGCDMLVHLGCVSAWAERLRRVNVDSNRPKIHP